MRQSVVQAETIKLFNRIVFQERVLDQNNKISKEEWILEN
jgi:hypothetical protein